MEKKDYEFKGTVSISTEEYRDLIEAVHEAEIKADKERTNWYKVYNEKSELEKTCKELSEQLSNALEFKYFVLENDEIKTKFKLAIAEKQLRQGKVN